MANFFVFRRADIRYTEGMRLRTKLMLLIAFPLLMAVGGYWGAPLLVEPPELPEVRDTRITDRNGRLLGFALNEQGYRKQGLPPGPLPQNLVAAVTAAEDNRFFSHGGVDALALARACLGHLRGTSRSGASTITMQLAKLLNPPTERSLSAKMRESLCARRLEMRHSKEELLRAYLNTADFGNCCQGAEAAAGFYFGKTCAELTLPEAALLAGLLQSPTRRNPLRHPQAALERRNAILKKLGADTAAPLGVAVHGNALPPVLCREAGQLTLDADLQADCSRIAAEEIERLQDRRITQAAALVLDNRTGEVLAAVPTALPSSPYGGSLNGLATPRSAGSTLKPFVYAQAFANGATPATVLPDVPTLYRSSDGVQAPRNYNEHYMGPISIRTALACSQNVPAMEALANYGGIPAFLELMRRLGFEVRGAEDSFGLGLAIGNAHVTLTELARAYSALARGGTLPNLATHLPLREGETPRVLDERICYQTADIMADEGARAPAFGLGHNLSFPFRCACKTGTSSNFRDNWCVGFTAEYTVAVWVGNFDNSSMRKVSGISGAGPIFRRVFLRLAEREKMSFPPRPAGLCEVELDTRTGLLPRADTPEAFRRQELLLAPLTRQGEYDAEGRALLSSRYAEWMQQQGDRRYFAVAEDSPTGRAPAILIPGNGTTVTLDPRLPENGSLLELRSTLPAATVRWHCNTLPIFRRGNAWYARLSPGRHTLHATDSNSGASATSSFRVR